MPPRRWTASATFMLVAVLGACDAGGGASHPARTTVTTVPQRYAVNATVLSAPDHGPELCAGAVLESLPPMCGGPPVAGWDWSRVPGVRTQSGTTWGEFHLVGTYDGVRFTPTEPPTAPAPVTGSASRPRPNFKTPCATPPGGWAITDPSRVSLDAMRSVSVVARRAPDFVGEWLDVTSGTTAHDGIPALQLYNEAFTGDLDRHRAELAAVWGGPLCVIALPRSAAQLQHVVDELLGATGHRLGLVVLSAAALMPDDVVWAEVLVADGKVRRAVDEAFGPGVVRLGAVLQPVP